MNKEFLSRIRDAAQRGPGAGAGVGGSEETTPRGRTDAREGRLFQTDLSRDEKINLFMNRAESSGAAAHRVQTAEELKALIHDLVVADSSLALACRERLARTLDLAPADLAPSSCKLIDTKAINREELFTIDAAITEVDGAIAETGSIAITAGTHSARLISLVAEMHIALVWPDQIEADLLDWTKGLKGASELPDGITLITGPSKTADIEIKLVVGVHGPAALHLIVVG